MRIPITTRETQPPESTKLDFEGSGLRLRRLGTSIHGWIYRSDNDDEWFRLIPLRQATGSWRADIKSLQQSKLSTTVARVTGTGMPSDLGFFLVRYGTQGPARSWLEILESPDLDERLERAESVLRTLPDWWNHLGTPLLPTPADIVFVDGQAVLLGVPPVSEPLALEAVLSDLHRCAYLAPEVVRSPRGVDHKNPREARNLDLYSVGVGILQAFLDQPEPGDLDTALRRAASGAAADVSFRQSRLPFWITQIQASRDAQETVLRLLHSDVNARDRDPVAAATFLASCRRSMDPLKAVEDLRVTAPKEAFQLLKAILVFREDEDLLLLGGRLARAQNPLEAIDFLERAITANPSSREAYEEQVRVICSGRAACGALAGLLASPGLAEQLDLSLLRDMEHLSESQRQDLSLDLARYLARRGEKKPELLDHAFKLIYDHLKDPKVTSDLDSNFVCAEVWRVRARTTSGKERTDAISAARAQCRRVGEILRDQANRIPPPVKERYASQLREFQHDLFIAEKGSAEGETT